MNRPRRCAAGAGTRALLVSVWLLLPAGAAGAAEELQTVTVRPGDTLWSMADTYLKDPTRWGEFLKYNTLASPDPSIALPGMSLKVPVRLVKEQYRAAKLVYYLKDVLFRRSGSSDWLAVTSRMDLYNNDALRTKEDSRADVKFYTGELLILYANSIAVLRPPNRKNMDVELMSGELRGQRSRVITASARITPKTSDTEYGARLKEDLTTLVQVYKGRADIEAHGKTVEVPEGFGTEVKMDLPPSAPVELPALFEFNSAPRTKLTAGAPPLGAGGTAALDAKNSVRLSSAPAPSAGDKDLAGAPATGDMNDHRLAAGGLPSVITSADPVQGYHIQLARNSDFTGMVLNKTFDVLEKIDLNALVPPGEYWLRTAQVDLLGFEGKFDAPRRVKVAGTKAD
ncbi:MAG: LysM peptidoglycan-binding domain-containing protein [Elusimicrobiota bacterium]